MTMNREGSRRRRVGGDVADRLARHGLRLTRQRAAVLAAIRSAEGHPAAHEVYERARRSLPRISLGTVYRTLGVLRDAGLVREVHFGRTESRYEEETEKHHHVICKGCGRIEDVPAHVFGDVVDRAREATQFQIQREKLEFDGLCPECRSGEARDDPFRSP